MSVLKAKANIWVLSKSFTTGDEETMSDLFTPVLKAKANIWVLSKLFTTIDVAQPTSVHAHVLLKTDGVVKDLSAPTRISCPQQDIY